MTANMPPESAEVQGLRSRAAAAIVIITAIAVVASVIAFTARTETREAQEQLQTATLLRARADALEDGAQTAAFLIEGAQRDLLAATVDARDAAALAETLAAEQERAAGERARATAAQQDAEAINGTNVSVVGTLSSQLEEGNMTATADIGYVAETILTTTALRDYADAVQGTSEAVIGTLAWQVEAGNMTGTAVSAQVATLEAAVAERDAESTQAAQMAATTEADLASLVITLIEGEVELEVAQSVIAVYQQASGEQRLDQFNALVGANPESALVYGLRAQELAARGAFAAAVEDYTRAIELRPNDPQAYLERARLYAAALDQPVEALADYERYLALGGIETQEVTDAIAALRAALPESAPEVTPEATAAPTGTP